MRNNLLSEALSKIDLAELVGIFYPNSGARAGATRCIAIWRQGEKESVSFFKGNDGVSMFKDYATDQTGNAHDWLVIACGMNKQKAAEYLIARAGLTNTANHNGSKNGSIPKAKSKIIATYDYLDLEGNLIAQTVRFEPKNFVQRRPDPNNSKGWIWGLKAGTYRKNAQGDWSKRGKGESQDFNECRTVIYNLQLVTEALENHEPVYVVEGEKDADNVTALGLVATCNIGGGGNWTSTELGTLKGADVILLADNDKVDKHGKRKGEEVAKKLLAKLKPIVNTISNPVFMPNGHKDVSDWIAAGGTREKLKQLAKNAKPIEKETTKETEETLKKESSPKALVRLVEAEGVTFFHSLDDSSYVSIKDDFRIETFSLKDSTFKRWLTHLYWKKKGEALSDQALKEALTILDARARFDGEQRIIWTRVARHDGKIYIDLANPEFEIVEISVDGWKLLQSSNCPVTFVRSKGMGAMPTPEQGGRLDELRAFIKVDDENWALIAAFIVGCFRPEGSYPILNLIAEQGSGKSTTAKIIKWLCDPSPTMGQLLRTAPRDDQGLFIGARNNHVLAFDNISFIKPWLSDALCILSTGGSFVTRTLYTDSEESSLQAMRPVILTGIGDLATRGDLLSRSLLVSLPRLDKTNLVGETQLWEYLEANRPRMLAGIFDALAFGLRKQTEGLDHQPETRLADFEMWAVACEEGAGLKQNEFIKAYRNSKANAADVVLSASPIASSIRNLLKACHGIWQGTAAELLEDLENITEPRTMSYKSWPRTAQILGNSLDRIAPSLRDVEIDVEKFRTSDKSRKRLIRLQDKLLTSEGKKNDMLS